MTSPVKASSPVKAAGTPVKASSGARPPVARYLVSVVALASVYWAVGRFGLLWAFTTGQVSAVWPASGVAVAALLLLGVRLWPGLYLGALLVNVSSVETFWSGAGIAVGNTLMALLVVFLLRRVVLFDPLLERTRDAAGLVAVAAVTSLVSATAGCANLAWHQVISWSDFGSVWLVWWFGDTIGILVVTPFLLAWLCRPLPRWQSGGLLECAAAFSLLAVVSVATLSGVWFAPTPANQVKYAVFPIVMWAALRFGPRGSASAVLFVTASAMWGVLSGLGPFSLDMPKDERLIMLDLLIGVLAMTALTLSAVVAEREEARASYQRLYAQQRNIAAAATAELQQAQRLESIGQLAGGIAHDFNNMLAAIMNYAALVADGLTTQERQRGLAADAAFTTLIQDVDEITKVVARAARLTHQLLIFSRREMPQSEVLDLNVIVREIEELLRRTIGENVDVGVVLAPDVPHIMADRGQIEQVLMNLIVNARDAMPEGGTLRIETAAFEADDDYARRHLIKGGTYARLVVADSGVGMSEDVMGKAFEPYFTTKEKTQGSGLGLATVYGIAKQAGGEVTLSSERGVGTTVRVHLPAAEGGTALVEPASRDRRLRAHGETILLVEDEIMVRTPTRRLLDHYGYTVLEAATATEALEVAREYSGQVSLLLTDVIMPGRSGRELADEMLQISPSTEVLYMSGYSAGFIVREGFVDKEEVHLIEKPFSTADLLWAIRSILDDEPVRPDSTSWSKT